MTENVTRLRTPKPCPICGKESVKAYHPFCSTRCADLDLGRWLKGRYVIPGKPLTEDSEEDGPPHLPDDDS